MNSLFLLFIGIPAIEVFLMIKIGGKIGALNTVSLILLTAVIGIYFAKLEGIKTIRSGAMNLYQNKIPIYEIMSGASIAVAAVMLIIPGFFTDFLGFMLLIPLTRNFIFSIFFKRKLKQEENHNKTIDGEIIDQKKDEL